MPHPKLHPSSTSRIAKQPAFGSRKLTGTFAPGLSHWHYLHLRGKHPAPVEGTVNDEGTQASSSEPTEVVSLGSHPTCSHGRARWDRAGAFEDLSSCLQAGQRSGHGRSEEPDQDSGDNVNGF